MQEEQFPFAYISGGWIISLFQAHVDLRNILSKYVSHSIDFINKSRIAMHMSLSS